MEAPRSIDLLLMHIAEHPGMYLGKKSIVLLKAFLGGWFVGARPGPEQDAYVRAFEAFIRERYNGSYSTAFEFLLLEECKGDDEAAFALFRRLFKRWSAKQPALAKREGRR